MNKQYVDKAIEEAGFKGPKEFGKTIEEYAKQKNIDYMEAVILFCEEHGVEVETAGKLIKSCAKLKAKIQLEAETLNFLPKSARLPVSDDD
jgi:hypothetical protein